jgi:hypothetical protein
MDKVWPWVFGIAIGLIIGLLLASGASNREAYWVARGPLTTHVVIVQPASENVELYRVHHYYKR